MMAHNEVYLRCAQLANASRVLGNLGDDILSKITLTCYADLEVYSTPAPTVHIAQQPDRRGFFLLCRRRALRLRATQGAEAEAHAEERRGYHLETGSDDGHFMALRGPVTLRHMRFRLTDLDGNVVRLRGSSLSFVLYLDHV